MTPQLRLLCVSSAALLSSCIYYPQGAYYQYPARPSYPGYYGPPPPSGGAGNYYRNPGDPSGPGGPPPATPYSKQKIFEQPTLDTDVPKEDRPSTDDAPSDASNDTPPPPRSGPSSDQPATKKPTGPVPVATRTNRPGRVKSPYAPHNELDVTGLPSGSLAKDPATGQVFRVP